MTPPVRREFIKTGGLALAAVGMGLTHKPSFTMSKQNIETAPADIPLPIGREELDQRVERARILMSKNNLDMILLTGGTSMKYFTGVTWRRSERTFAWLLPIDGEPIWVCPAFERDRAEERTEPNADIRTWQEDESPYELISDFLKKTKSNKGKLGIEETVRYFVTEGISNAAKKVNIVSADRVINGCRGIKTTGEIELLRYINKVTLEVIRTSFKEMKNGMTQGELSGVLSSEYAKRGLRGWALVLFGPNAAFPNGTKNPELLSPGKLVLVDTGTSIHGYQSDITRTTVFGEPTKRQLEVWSTVREAQSMALEKAKPGVKAGDVDKVARSVIVKAGFGKGYSVFTHRLGHGIGMDGHEFPYLVKGNKLKLQAGMTFSNEPGIYIRGELGVRLEDIMHITESGAELLTQQSESILSA